MPTIAAIATARGQGGISIIRMSGPGAKTLLGRVFLPRSMHFSNFRPWTLHHGAILDSNDEPLDDVLAVYMPGPRTYTGEEMVEIHCHGGAFIADAALESLIRLGARQAEPGEFTRRAYLNGRMDLSQAEAVAEMIAAQSKEALRYSLDRLEGRLADKIKSLNCEIDELRALARIGIDFPDDEVDALSRDEFAHRISQIIAIMQVLLKGAARVKLMSEGALTVLAGEVNAGKSSLFNALVGHRRALVTDIPGTTRDYLEAQLNISGLPVRLIDTAGLREDSHDAIERLGIANSRLMLENADMICLVIDLDKPLFPVSDIIQDIRALNNDAPLLVIGNKEDLTNGEIELPSYLASYPFIAVSALAETHIEELAEKIYASLMSRHPAGSLENAPAPNSRQAFALEQALSELEALKRDIENNVSYDCCLARLDTASHFLSQILHLDPEDQLLDRIFSKFCIGK